MSIGGKLGVWSIVASHWLSHGSFSLAGSLAGQGEKSSFLLRSSSKVSFCLSRSVRIAYSCWNLPGVVNGSFWVLPFQGFSTQILNKISSIHFHNFKLSIYFLFLAFISLNLLCLSMISCFLFYLSFTELLGFVSLCFSPN